MAHEFHAEFRYRSDEKKVIEGKGVEVLFWRVSSVQDQNKVPLLFSLLTLFILHDIPETDYPTSSMIHLFFCFDKLYQSA